MLMLILLYDSKQKHQEGVTHLRSVPSSPGRSTLTLKNINLDSLDSCSYLAHPSWIAIYLNVHNSIVQLRDHNSCFSVLFVLSSSCLDFKLDFKIPYYSGFRPYHTSTILHTILLDFGHISISSIAAVPR